MVQRAQLLHPSPLSTPQTHEKFQSSAEHFWPERSADGEFELVGSHLELGALARSTKLL